MPGADAFAVAAGTGRASALRQAARTLESAGVEAPLREARLLLLAALAIDAAALLRDPDAPLSPREAARFSAFLARRRAREPFARIVGRREFHGLDFDLVPATLVPRPDTETLVEAVRDEAVRRGLDHRPARIVDLGVGSGAILAALLNLLPLASGLGIDASPQACAAAARNLDRHAPGRAETRLGDWLSGIAERFDVIVSNPPYIASADIAALDPEVAGGEPALALDGGADGLCCYRSIAAGAGACLAPGGFLGVEIGAGQAADVGAIFGAAGFRRLAARADLGGHVRALLFEAA